MTKLANAKAKSAHRILNASILSLEEALMAYALAGCVRHKKDATAFRVAC